MRVDTEGAFDQISMFAPDHAVARATDPDTSHEAAASIDADKLSEDRKAVLLVLRSRGPLCDQDIFLHLTETGYNISPSGCRTRRKELCDIGLVEWSGHRIKLRTGRKSRIWQATEPR